MASYLGLGPDNAFPSGPDNAFPSGPDNAFPSGPDNAFPSGPDNAFPSGPDNAFPSGPDNAFPSGPDNAFPSGPDNAFPSGPDNAFPSGPDNAFPSGPDNPFPSGPDNAFPSGPDNPFPSGPDNRLIIKEHFSGPAAVTSTPATELLSPPLPQQSCCHLHSHNRAAVTSTPATELLSPPLPQQSCCHLHSRNRAAVTSTPTIELLSPPLPQQSCCHLHSRNRAAVTSTPATELLSPPLSQQSCCHLHSHNRAAVTSTPTTELLSPPLPQQSCCHLHSHNRAAVTSTPATELLSPPLPQQSCCHLHSRNRAAVTSTPATELLSPPLPQQSCCHLHSRNRAAVTSTPATELLSPPLPQQSCCHLHSRNRAAVTSTPATELLSPPLPQQSCCHLHSRNRAAVTSTPATELLSPPLPQQSCCHLHSRNRAAVTSTPATELLSPPLPQQSCCHLHSRNRAAVTSTPATELLSPPLPQQGCCHLHSHNRAAGSVCSSHQISPQEFLGELKSGVTDERLMACLDSLRVSLTSNPVSWVQSFGHEGLGLLLDILEKLLHKKHQDKPDKKSQHKVIQCLKAFMNNKYGLDRILSEEKCLSLLARAIDPTQPAMMTDVVKLLSAICIVGEENTLEKVLEAVTTAGEHRATERFSPIVEGLRDCSVQLQVACMQLINALVTSPDELDFRLHIRNEFIRSGLREIFPHLTTIRNDALDIQLKVFEEHKEEDLMELSHRLEDIKSELDDVGDVFNVVQSVVKDTGAEVYFLSILQHLMLIRNDYFVRPQYFKIIDECLSQIVLHRSGTDPDFSYRKRLDVDFSVLLDVCVDKAQVEECELRATDLALKFDEEYLGRQEAQAQLLKSEEKINELQAELLAFKSQFGAVALTHSSARPPLPPPPSGPGGPVPPPPPPPPLPGCGPPPPPGVPPPFGCPPPPPPPPGFCGLGSPTHNTLPFGLRPKKQFKLETSMKRLNWSKIRPQEMSESCFWVVANEDRYDNPDLLNRLAHTFGSYRPAIQDEQGLEAKRSIKKRIKQLKVLDPKIAQNLSIFLGSFRMPYQEIRRAVLEVDEEQLTEPMIQNLVKHLPEQEQLNALMKFQNDYNSLSEPEQFGVVMSSVKRLRPRLNSILFKLQFDEQVNNLRPDIMAVNAACEEVRKSKGFSRLLELVLLLGNYMNTGSRNAQSYGFDLSSLCKLKDTKSADQKSTLLHFLAAVCEEEFPEVTKFSDDLQHVDRASRVSAESLEKNLVQMERQLVQLERDLDTFSSPDDSEDLFTVKMSSFATSAREQYQKLMIMHGNMGTLYQNMLDYFALDSKKISVEELFTDLSNFRTMFLQALKENVRRREAEEKQRRAWVAKEKAEREKQERQQQKKRRLLEVNAENSDETGVMDSLLEALQSGAAFRDRRKRAPRPRDGQMSLSPSSYLQVLKPCNHVTYLYF
ncbi:protein diaphanous homolog 3-like [Oncorhynchus masou masou]|uniref:protein diaphanous homolog 3-like n=2 Tax=Oncorhynchus masou masou TaxID=90313 RepID=UPI0031843297